DIIIGKPLGIGILSHMIKNASLSESAYKKMISYTTRLNTPGRKFAGISEVHAMTDVTGFGLLGHLLEICKSSGVSAEIRFAEIPLISESVEYVKRENFPGAVERNWKSYSHLVEIPGEMEHWQRRLLCDPQTSGGLLLSASPTHTKEILSMFHESGFPEASVIGKMHNLNQESLVQVIQKS
ncbi:MAG: selenide, water dikinase SelD, partial [Spirochaetia bacterium]|nr:selenide, water dikinase SelD [Spirochaetia bacterium]